METVGRNEPCPCGSGKKYKKCCMLKDTAVDLEVFRADRAEESLRGEILKFATGERFRDEMVEAFKTYQGDEVESGLMGMSQTSLENIRFLDWFINEHLHSTENKTIIDLFGELRSKNLEEDQKKLLEEWRASRLGAFEVESTEGGALKLVDIFTGDAHLIEDQSACDEVETGMIVVARVTTSWGKKELAGAPALLEADSKQKLVDSMNAEFEKSREDNPDADLAQFLSENTHLLIATATKLA